MGGSINIDETITILRLLLEGKPVPKHKISENKLLQDFTEAVLDSQYATIITLIHGNLKPIVGDETFLKAYAMANLYEDPEEAVKILQRKVPYDEELLLEIVEKDIKKTAYGFMREIFWLEGSDPKEIR